MSVSRSPIRNESRRRDELADVRKVVAWLCFLAAFGFVAVITAMAWPR